MASTGLGPGMILDGKYEILNRLGAGGMGEVFKARHLHLNTFRCIKVLKQALLDDEGVRNRFLREARLATQIHHPNIAVVHDFFLGDGGSYMVTEFIDGTTVRQWSAAHGPFPLALAADVAAQVLSGLDHIHRRGLLHRDISPDNVMLTYDGDDRLIAKIIDLGIAKDINTVSADTTQAGVLIGNPKYMSPEQFGMMEDSEQLDGRADLYCLGVVLYEMLLGVPPFQSETPQGYIMKHLTEKPRRFAQAKPEMVWTSGVEDVIFRVLEKDRRRRFNDAREMRAALERFLLASPGGLSRDTVANMRRGRSMASDLPTQVIELPPQVNREEEKAFQQAWEDGRSSAWRTFLETYPDSKDAARAREFLEETLAFESAVHNDSETGLREFLKSWPEGRHHLEAEIRLVSVKQRLADNAYAQAVEADTYAALRDFLARYPSAPRAEEAKRIAAERLAFETAQAADSEEAWELYLAKWKDDRHADDARARLERAKAREEEAYRRAVAAKSVAAWDEFLAAHPDGKRNAKAQRNRREAVAFEEARGGGRVALQDFVRRFSDGLLVKDAQRLLRQVQDTEDFEHAQSMNTPAAWQLYLLTHAGGAHAATARERLVALEDEAFAAVMASKDPEAAAQFLSNFRDSPRRDELTRVSAKWRESAAVQQALDAVAKDDVARAQSLLAQITDPERRNEIESAIASVRERERKKLAKTEPADWNTAWESGSVAAWDRYLSVHGDSARASEARECRQEASDFEQAIAADSKAMWRAFLKSWPEGRHHIDAAIRMRASK